MSAVLHSDPVAILASLGVLLVVYFAWEMSATFHSKSFERQRERDRVRKAARRSL